VLSLGWEGLKGESEVFDGVVQIQAMMLSVNSRSGME
jgi:hypothetical protein